MVVSMCCMCWLDLLFIYWNVASISHHFLCAVISIINILWFSIQPQVRTCKDPLIKTVIQLQPTASWHSLHHHIHIRGASVDQKWAKNGHKMKCDPYHKRFDVQLSPATTYNCYYSLTYPWYCLFKSGSCKVYTHQCITNWEVELIQRSQISNC